MIQTDKAKLKEKLLGSMGSVSGIGGILGSWQVCHNVCLGIVALLGIIGITVTGMPLLFLTKLALPFWIIAFVLLILTFFLYIKKKCISKNLILFNSGLIIAGIPFQELQRFSIYFWIIGGCLSITAIIISITNKLKTKKP